MGVKYKIVPDCPLYRVGTDGTVWSLWQPGPNRVVGTKWRKLKGSVNPGGYVMVCMRRTDRTVKRKYLSHLVLEAFVGPKPHPKMQACHNNGKNSDNSVGNLRWDTAKNNIADKDKHGTMARGERNGHTDFVKEQIMEIRQRLAAGDSQDKLAADYNCSQSTISRIKLRQVWHHI